MTESDLGGHNIGNNMLRLAWQGLNVPGRNANTRNTNPAFCGSNAGHEFQEQMDRSGYVLNCSLIFTLPGYFVNI